MHSSHSKKNRLKGQGHLFKRGKTYYLQYTINKNRKKISLGCTSEREAKAQAENILNPVRDARTIEEIAVHVGKARALVKDNRVKIEDVWTLYIKSTNRPDSSKGTLGNYERMWGKFKDWLIKSYPSISSFGQITNAIAYEYAEHLWEKKISANTFNYHIQALRLVAKVLVKEAVFDKNPWDGISRKAESKQSRKELNEDEIMKILKLFDTDTLKVPFKDEMKVMFHFGVWTGLRLMDCALMKWANVDLVNGRITCLPIKTQHKTGRTVIIPIHASLRKSIDSALSWRRNEYVMPGVAETYIKNPTSVKHFVIKIFQLAGFDTTQEVENVQRKRRANIYGFHSFRHSFVSFCAKGGVPLPIVQSIVGHGNPAMTRHYVHIGEESAKRAIAALPMAESKRAIADSPEERIKKAIKWIEKASKIPIACKSELKRILVPACQN